MQRESYKTRKGVQQYRPVMTEAEYRGSDNTGFCLACGMEAYGVEPDARQYPCESCEARKVYGIQELLMMDLVKLQGGE